MIGLTVFNVFILKISTKYGRKCSFVITEKLKCREVRRLFSWTPGKVNKGSRT